MPTRLPISITGLILGIVFFAGTIHGQDGLTNDMTVDGGRRARAPQRQNPPPPARQTANQRQTHANNDIDVLPMRFADMNQYDQIAMEPYRDKYDSLPLVEKADLYAKQFEFMRNRPPRFEPEIMSLLNSYSSPEGSKTAASAYRAKQHLYKPATPKAPTARSTREQASRQRPDGMPVLSGPWSSEPATPDDSEPETPPPATPRYSSDGTRMENLRRGWNAADVMRGSRTH